MRNNVAIVDFEIDVFGPQVRAPEPAPLAEEAAQ